MPDSASTSLLNRHFVLLWAMTFLTFFAAFQLFPTVPLRLRELGASLAESGRFMSVFTVGSAFGALFTGPLGDRVGRRRMVIVTACLYGCMTGAYGFLQHRWLFYTLALPHGIVWSGLLTATMATLGGILPLDRRADGLSLYGLASPVGVIFGPLLGLIIYRGLGFSVMCWGILGAFLLLSILATTLPMEPPHREYRPLFQWPERNVVIPCSVFLTMALGYGALGTYTAQEALALHFPPLFGRISTASAFLSFMAIGMVITRIVMVHRGFGLRPVQMLPRMLWTALVGLVLLAAMPGGLGRHVVSALLYGAGYSMMHTLVSAHVLDVAHPNRRGAAFGATLFAFDLGIGLGTYVLGLIIGAYGFRWGWAGAALLAALSLPLAQRLVKGGSAQIRNVVNTI